MNGTITIDIDQDRQAICNATRYKPPAHSRKIIKLSHFGDVLAFVSNYVDKINGVEPWSEYDQ